MQASLVLMASRSGVPGLWSAGGAVLPPEGALVTALLVLIFGSSDLTCGADPASAGISRAVLSLVLIWGAPDPVCGAGETSGRGSSCTADSLVLICPCFIRSPGDGTALPLSARPAPETSSLAETASRVLIRGRSRGIGSWGEGCSAGTSGGGGSAGISCVSWSAVVRDPSVCSWPLADFFFFSRASTPRRA